MKNREAIEYLNDVRNGIHIPAPGIERPLLNDKEKEAVDLAISALEKQETAKIVVRKSRGGVTLWHECGKCGEPVDAKDMFCSGCGRKLIPLPEPYTEEDNDKP